MANNKRSLKLTPPTQQTQAPLSITPTKRNIAVGISFFRLNEAYGMKAFCDMRGKIIGERDLFRELDDFRRKASQMNDMIAFLTLYQPHNGQPKTNAFRSAEAERLRENYGFKDFEEARILHIHAKMHGKGETVLWGFVYDNVFELLAIDPKHETI